MNYSREIDLSIKPEQLDKDLEYRDELDLIELVIKTINDSNSLMRSISCVIFVSSTPRILKYLKVIWLGSTSNIRIDSRFEEALDEEEHDMEHNLVICLDYEVEKVEIDSFLKAKVLIAKQVSDSVLINRIGLNYDEHHSRHLALSEFGKMLIQNDHTESEWQSFFEKHKWILNNYGGVSCSEFGNKLMHSIGGVSLEKPNKIVDVLRFMDGPIKTFSIIEIKRACTNIFHKSDYRKGIYNVTSDLSGAVAQVQEYMRILEKKFDDIYNLKDAEGYDTGEVIYNIRTKGIVIIGNTTQFKKESAPNHEMYISFERFRKSLSNIDVITFDELYHNAKNILN